MIGETMAVLIDEIKDEWSIGRTEFDSPEVDNRVIVHGDLHEGDFVQVEITDANEFELIGSVVNPRKN